MAWTFTGGIDGNFNGTANLTAVPEPATWGLMLLGFGAMGGMLRTRRRRGSHPFGLTATIPSLRAPTEKIAAATEGRRGFLLRCRREARRRSRKT